jgi:hypothetical protein
MTIREILQLTAPEVLEALEAITGGNNASA